ncbi:MAG: putative ribosome biogenesis GTPase RsgA [Bacteroidia bacterium]|nr:MAG: putative ribosome biogenesis GTPase RsgA [Bacteroidia bacterium]
MKGTVIKSTGSWYQVLAENKQVYECRLKGNFRLKGQKNTNPITVGDHVEIEIETNTQNAVIASLDERKNYIIRKATNLSKQTHIIASNIDQAILVVTLAYPRTSTGFIDRFLVTAEAYSIPVIIVFNKADMYEGESLELLKELASVYQNAGYKTLLTSAIINIGLEELRALMKDKVSLISGHSGVGKSTLINALEPSLNLKVSEISETHEKGMHTTTFAEMFPLSFGGFIIDTPGIKEFGIVDIKPEELGHFFPEIRKLMQNCKYNNLHASK